MTDSQLPDESSPQSPQPRDSRLETFLRKATPILKSERGLGTAGRLKLRALADELKLPPELFDRAIEQLSRNAVKSLLSRSERQFVKFVQSELNQLKQSILTTRIEERAIAIGVERYQIGAERARELLRRTAAESGINRVARSDAESFLRRTTEQLIGSCISVSDDLRERVHAQAASWEISAEIADAIVDSIVQHNLQQRRRKAVGPTTLALILTGILTLATAITVVIFVTKPFADSPAATKPIRSTAATIDPLVQPDWWSGELYQAAAALAGDNTVVRTFLVDAASSDTSQRHQALAAAVAGQMTFRSTERTGIPIDLFAAILIAEPDRSVQMGIADQLVLSIDPPNRPTTVEDLQRAERNLEILLSVRNRLSNESTDSPQLVETLENLDLEGRLSRTALAERFLRSNAEHAWTDAATTAEFIAQAKLPEEVLRSTTMIDTLFMVLDADVRQWRSLRSSIESALRHSSPTDRLAWAQRITPVVDDEFSRWLANELAVMSKVTVSPQDPEQAQSILLAALAPRSPQQIELESRVVQWRTAIDQWDAIRESQSRPQQIAHAAFLATLAWDLWLAERYPVNSDFNRFDQLLESGVPNLDADDGPRNDLIPETPNAMDQEALANAVQALVATDGTSLSRRNALRKLGELADRFVDIRYDQASIVADYFLGAGERELIEVEQTAFAIRRWPTLTLALSDQLDVVDVPANSAANLFAVIQQQNIPVGTSLDWRSELRDIVLQRLIEDLRARQQLSRDASVRQWDSLEAVFGHLVRHRVDSFQAALPSSKSADRQSVAALQSWLILQVVNERQTESPNKSLMRELALLPEVVAPGLPLTIELEFLFLRAISESDDNPRSGNDPLAFTAMDEQLLFTQQQLVEKLKRNSQLP